MLRYTISDFLEKKNVAVSLEKIVKIRQEEPMFYWIISIVRIFTSNYVVYFIIIYSFICISFIHFLIQHSDKNNILSPLIYIIVPIIGSFNVIRSWFAVAIILFAITSLVDGKYKKFILLCFFGFLTHSTSIIILITYVIVNVLMKLQKIIHKKILFVLLIIIIYLSINFGKDFLRNILIDTKFRSYADYTNSIIGQFTTIAIGILTLINYEKLMNRMGTKYKYFVYFVLVNFAFVPFVVNFGFWRMIDFFIFPRLIVWTNILKIYELKFFNYSVETRIFYRFLVFIIFSGWTFFRIYRMWYTSGVMPYRNIIF